MLTPESEFSTKSDSSSLLTLEGLLRFLELNSKCVVSHLNFFIFNKAVLKFPPVAFNPIFLKTSDMVFEPFTASTNSDSVYRHFMVRSVRLIYFSVNGETRTRNPLREKVFETFVYTIPPH